MVAVIAVITWVIMGALFIYVPKEFSYGWLKKRSLLFIAFLACEIIFFAAMINKTSAEWAAWIQAFGSVGAIIGAVAISRWQHNRSNFSELARDIAIRRSLYKKVSIAVSELVFLFVELYDDAYCGCEDSLELDGLSFDNDVFREKPIDERAVFRTREFFNFLYDPDVLVNLQPSSQREFLELYDCFEGIISDVRLMNFGYEFYRFAIVREGVTNDLATKKGFFNTRYEIAKTAYLKSVYLQRYIQEATQKLPPI